MAKKNKPYTTDTDYAFNKFDSPVNCGDCYQWYDITKHEKCPCCGSHELVGDR